MRIIGLLWALACFSDLSLVYAQQPTPDTQLLETLKGHTGRLNESLKNGANPNAKFPDGTSALQFVLRDNPFEMGINSNLYLLLKSGASIDGLNADDQVRLYCFVARMSIEVPGDHIGVVSRNDGDHPALGQKFLKQLAEKGMQISMQDSQGNTPIMIAVLSPTQAEFFQWLLDNGAETGTRNKKGQTALDIFRESSQAFIKSSEEDGGFEGAEAYHAKNKKLLAEAERVLTKTAKPATSSDVGPLVGKIFSVNGKQLEITGAEITKLKKGQKLLIGNSANRVHATVSETLHTKVKARIIGKGAVVKGASVYLAR